jgi:3-phosphoshikimate 1-carboxyvinyltransferase
MSKVLIESDETNLVATIQLPSSKSISNRAYILQQVVQQKTAKSIAILYPSDADDTLILKQALAEPTGTIDIKNAGTCLRFLTAYFAATPGIIVTITGSERMKQRPIEPLVSALIKLGASISYLEENNCLPIQINGCKLTGGAIDIPANESSQFVSALMLIAPLMENELTLNILGEIVSKHYIVMTQTMLKQFGFNCNISDNYSLVQTENSLKEELAESYAIEADWSSAAFFYEAAVIADKADILFPGLILNSIQGDVILAKWMEELGIRTIEKEEGLYITKGKLPGKSNFEFNFSDNPDLAPAMICATAGASYILNATGISSLAHKESNRIEALAKGLQQLHYKVKTSSNSLEHDGLQHAFYENSVIETQEDHRITMAFAMLAILQSNIVLSETESVIKSFPNFWQEAAKIGINVRYNKAQQKEHK